jgi:triosephosphate isomerase (TIM)
MNHPIIVINYKTYENSIGKNAVILSKLLEMVAEEQNKSIAVCVSACDIKSVSENIKIPVLAQHTDGVDFGAHTGRILAKAIKENGAVGSLINHSEDRYNDIDKIKAAIDKLREEKMISILCAKDEKESEMFASLNPDYIAVEPPELIGGDISVTTANPKVVSDTVDAIKKVAPHVNVLCGAGVKTGADVKKAIELGCAGVLLASGITKVKDPKAALTDMCQGLN